MSVPWDSITQSEDELSSIPGMIEPVEKQMLYWATRDHYAGLGEIVELGTFLGTSTECLCKGLLANQRVKVKEGRVHCYDLFLRSESVNVPYASWLDPYNIAVGGSFLPVVENHLKAYRDLILFNPGDIMRQIWIGRPIEILFVDMAVSWAVSDQVVRRFFSALIPGRSLIIHQDYFYQKAPWLGITMEYFADYFGMIGNAESSMVFHLKRPIPEDLLQRGTECLMPQHKLALIESLRQRYSGMDGNAAKLTTLHRAALLALLGDRNGAERVTHEVLATSDHPTVINRAQSLLQDMPQPSWQG